MIVSLTGKIIEKRENAAVLGVNDVGYLVYVPAGELAAMTAGSAVVLATYLVVKEDALDLYGSRDPQVLAWFKMLLNVKGVGPKSALSIVSTARPEDLSAALQAENADVLVSCGISRKVAERIVLELKTKAKALIDIKDARATEAITLDAEALQALEALGYSREQARAALKEAQGESIEEKVRGALRVLGK